MNADIQLTNTLLAAAKAFGVSVSDILGKKRTREVVDARHAAIYALRKDCKWNLENIGLALNKCHQAINHSVKAVDLKIESADDSFEQKLIKVRGAVQ